MFEPHASATATSQATPIAEPAPPPAPHATTYTAQGTIPPVSHATPSVGPTPASERAYGAATVDVAARTVISDAITCASHEQAGRILFALDDARARAAAADGKLRVD